jgi:hypothetical protein
MCLFMNTVKSENEQNVNEILLIYIVIHANYYIIILHECLISHVIVSVYVCVWSKDRFNWDIILPNQPPSLRTSVIEHKHEAVRHWSIICLNNKTKRMNHVIVVLCNWIFTIFSAIIMCYITFWKVLFQHNVVVVVVVSDANKWIGKWHLETMV